MKRVLFFLVSTAFCYVSLAQDFPTKNSILGIERHLMKEDFLLNESNGVFPVKVTETKEVNGFMGTSNTVTTLIFNENNQLISKRTLFEYESTKEDNELKFTYNNSRLTKIDFFEKGKQSFYFPQYNYIYNDEGRLAKILTKRTSISEPYSIAEFLYLNNGNEIIKTDENGKRTKYVLSNNQKSVASEEELNENNAPKSAKIYMPSGRGIKVIHYPDLINAAQKQEDIAEYFVDEKGSVFKSFEKVGGMYSNKDYALLYDKHNNWVAKISKANNDIIVREITYSNSDVTGYTSMKDPRLLAAMKSEESNESINVPTNGVYWKKSGELFWFYNNGTEITDPKWLYRDKNTDVAYSSINHSFYEIYNYEASPEKQFHKGKKITTEIGEKGFWFFTQENNKRNDVLINLNGDFIDWANDSQEAYYSEAGDLVLVLSDDRLVMENYQQHLTPYTIYPLIEFDVSRHTKPVSKSDQIAQDKKKIIASSKIKPGTIVTNNNTNFYVSRLYLDGCIGVNSLPFPNNKNLEFYNNKKHHNSGNDPLFAGVYYSGDIKKCEIDRFQTIKDAAICHECDGNGSYYGYKDKNVSFTSEKTTYNTPHKGDYYEVNERTTTTNTTTGTVKKEVLLTCSPCQGMGAYILDKPQESSSNSSSNSNFNWNETSSSTASSTSSTNFTVPSHVQNAVSQWLDGCNEDTNCIRDKFDTWFNAQEAQKSSTAQMQKLTADVTKALYNTQNKLPFQLLAKTRSKYYDYYSEIIDTDKIPKEISDHIKSSGKAMMDSYNKHLNSEETRKKVESYGGSMNYKKGN